MIRWCVSSLLLVAATVWSAEVRLRPTATAATSSIKLGEIADTVDSFLAMQIVVDVPAEQTSITLDLTKIRDRLYQNGVDLTTLSFRGAGKVVVTITQPTKTSPPPAKPDPAAPEWKEIILTALRQRMLSEGYDISKIEIKLDTALAVEQLNRSRPTTWDLLVPAEWKPGNQTVQLELKQGATTSVTPISVYLAIKTPVVVARRAVKRDEIIKDTDIELVSATSSEFAGEPLRQADLVVGKRASRPIEAKQPIYPKDVTTQALVYRGSTITVRVKSGTAVLEMTGVAQNDAGLGEWVDVINPTTKRPLAGKAKVVGHQTAELGDPQPRSTP